MKIHRTGGIPALRRFRVLRVWGIILAVLSLHGNSLSASAQSVPLSPHLYHEPVLTAPAGRSVEISLIAEEGVSNITSASLLWRRPGGEFRTADMEPTPEGLAYTIPSADVTPAYLEYAILVRFSDGGSASFPLADPLVSPQVIAVIEEAEPELGGPEYVVLYPQEGDLLFEPEVRIAVSIFDPDTTFDPATMEVFLDGEKIEIGDLTRNFLFAKVADVKSGKHVVTLRSRDYDGQPNPDFSWYFRSALEGEERLPATFSWAFTGEGALEDFGGETEGIARGDFRARGELGQIKYTARAYMTSEEAWDRQPQNRFLFGLQGRNFHLNLGDTYPIFSDLVLSGKRVRGVQIGVNTRGYHLVGVFGEINKPIEDRTYRRYLYGLRSHYAAPGGACVGLSLLKAKDDSSSINSDEAAVSPQDNVVVGLDFNWPFFARKLEWSFSAAFSMTALDIRGGSLDREALKDADVEIPFDPEPWEPLLIINESLTPPNPLEWGSIAWMTKLTLREFGHYLSLNYRNIGPSYFSLGNPYLQNDLSGWSLTDQFSLWKRYVFVNIGLDQQRDNLWGTKTATTSLTGGWITLAIYPAAPAPALTLALNYHHSGNSISDISSTGDSTVFIDQRRDEDYGTLSATLVQNINLFDRKHTLSLNMNQSQFKDGINDRPSGFSDLNSSSSNFGFLWRSDLTRNVSFSTAYSYYSSEIGSFLYKYNQFRGTLGGRYLNRKLQFSLGGHRRTGEDDLSRWQANLRADWEFYPKHALRADASRYFNDTSQDEGVYRIYYFKRF